MCFCVVITLSASFQAQQISGKMQLKKETNKSKIAASNKKYSAYLFAYFTGNAKEEAIRFALSNDGYNYMALNGNNPIIVPINQFNRWST